MSWEEPRPEEFLAYNEKYPEKWEAVRQEALSQAEQGLTFSFREILIAVRRKGTPIGNPYRLYYRDKFIMAYPEHAHRVSTSVSRRKRYSLDL